MSHTQENIHPHPDTTPSPFVPVQIGFVGREIQRIEQKMDEVRHDGQTWCYLFAARQALSWAVDPNAAKGPLDTIMDGGVMPLRAEDDYPSAGQ